jgi:Glycosyl hydrolases family 18
MTTAKCKIFQSTFLGSPEDHDWENMWRTIEKGKRPFKYVDRLEIAFANIITKDPDRAHLEYSYADRAKKTLIEARNENPGIEIIAQMGWADGLLPLLKDENKARSRLDAFAKSIPGFLKAHDLQGIDYDWENINRKPKPNEGAMTTEYATFLFEQTRKYLRENQIPLLTITPDGEYPTGQFLDIAVVNRLFDAVIVQSYGRVEYVDQYIKAGIKPSIIYYGICSERDPQWWPEGDVSPDIKPYTDKVEQYKLPGLYSWRIDNDDADAKKHELKYTITTSMWKYSRGSLPNPPLFP